MIILYRILTNFLYPFFVLIIFFRTFINKEDPRRFKEKFFLKKSLKNNIITNKKVIWIHAASIGEVNSIIPLIREILKRDNNLFILLTTITLTSGKLIEDKLINLKNFKHCYFPLDIKFIIKQFLNLWNPKLVIFVDSEVWPTSLFQIKRSKIPLVLLNGRITKKSFDRWRWLSKFSKKVFSLYDLCLPSSRESEKNLKILGAKNIKFIGNIKFSSDISNEKISQVEKLILDKHNVWCAASTHPGEEEIILRAHMKIKRNNNNVITIIIPRHTNRSGKIFSLCKSLKLKTQILEENDKIKNEQEVIIINSFGGMIKYFNYCKSVFMGKSLLKKLIKVGGQNPIEPAKCGCKIYHGSYISNFKEIYSDLQKRGIANEISDYFDLSEHLIDDFKTKKATNNKYISDLDKYGKNIMTKTIDEILEIKNDNSKT